MNILKYWVIVVLNYREIQKILNHPPTRSLSGEERQLLWKFRFSLMLEKRALTKFLRCVDWTDAQVCSQYHFLGSLDTIDNIARITWLYIRISIYCLIFVCSFGEMLTCICTGSKTSCWPNEKMGTYWYCGCSGASLSSVWEWRGIWFALCLCSSSRFWLLMMPGSALVMVVYCLVVLRTRLSRRRLEDRLHILHDFLNSKKSVKMDCSFQVMVAICGTHILRGW